MCVWSSKIDVNVHRCIVLLTLTVTAINPAIMMNAWKTSVQTTALNPPCQIRCIVIMTS